MRSKVDSNQMLLAYAVMSGKTDKHREYERRKKLIDKMILPPKEYERALKRLSDELGV